MLQLVLFLFTVGAAGAVCIYDERLLSPLVPFGLVALALLVSEFERRGLFAPFARRKVCEVGADGLLIGKSFFSWRAVLWAQRDEGYSGQGESSEYNRRVAIGLRDGATVYVEPFNPEAFVLEVLSRSKPRPVVNDTATETYRQTSAPSQEHLVRVAIDGSAKVEERIQALQRLDGDERERVEHALVDRRLQREE